MTNFSCRGTLARQVFQYGTRPGGRLFRSRGVPLRGLFPYVLRMRYLYKTSHFWQCHTILYSRRVRTRAAAVCMHVTFFFYVNQV